MYKIFSFEYQSEKQGGIAFFKPPDDDPFPTLYQITLNNEQIYIIKVVGVTTRWVQLDNNLRPHEMIQAIGKGLEETGVVISKWKLRRHHYMNLIMKLTSW